MVEFARDEGETLEDRGDGEQANADPVLTETAGDLYARQGLHERAAEVYARLVEERPEDGDLREKLERAREAVARRTGHEAAPAPTDEVDGPSDGAASGGDASGPDPADEGGDDRGELEEVESAWTGGDGALAAEQTPYAWEEEPATALADGATRREAVAERSVGEYLRKLLSWRPSALVSARSEPEAGDRDAGGAAAIWPATSPDLGSEIVERLTTREADGESSGGSPWERAAASRGRGFGAVERLASGPSSVAGQFREAPGRASAEEEDDDDLEMFRAWLQSLKR